MSRLKVLIAGGGTGGHLFPGMAIAESILKKNPTADIRFAGTKKGIEATVIPKHGYQLYTLSVSGLYRVGLVKKIIGLGKLPFALLQSLWILITFNPHVVIGVGGYVSGPILALAILLAKKTVIQEQNASPGLTNRLLGKFVSLVFVPFEGMEQFFKSPRVVGNPVRKAILDLRNLPDERDQTIFSITIFGGSQGAAILNETLSQTLPLLHQYFDHLTMLHQTGPRQWQWVKTEYEKHSVHAEIVPFIDDMAGAYRKSNLLICRSGSSVNEIIAAGRASILVPIAFSSGDHQRKNALQLEANGAALLIEQKELTPELLAQTLIDLMEHPSKVQAMELCARKMFAGDASEIIAETILHKIQLK